MAGTSIALTFFSNQSNPPTHLIKMGNRYTSHGPEFWYVYGDPESKFLTLKLKGDSYKKIVLEFDSSTNFDQIIQELDATTKNTEVIINNLKTCRILFLFSS